MYKARNEHISKPRSLRSQALIADKKEEEPKVEDEIVEETEEETSGWGE